MDDQELPTMFPPCNFNYWYSKQYYRSYIFQDLIELTVSRAVQLKLILNAISFYSH